MTKEDLGVLSSSVVAAVLGVCGEGQGEALGTGNLSLTSLCGLSLRVNKVHPGGSRGPAEGSAGIVDGSPRGIQQSLSLALLCRGLAPGQVR